MLDFSLLIQAESALFLAATKPVARWFTSQVESGPLGLEQKYLLVKDEVYRPKSA